MSEANGSTNGADTLVLEQDDRQEYAGSGRRSPSAEMGLANPAVGGTEDDTQGHQSQGLPPHRGTSGPVDDRQGVPAPRPGGSAKHRREQRQEGRRGGAVRRRPKSASAVAIAAHYGVSVATPSRPVTASSREKANRAAGGAEGGFKASTTFAKIYGTNSNGPRSAQSVPRSASTYSPSSSPSHPHHAAGAMPSWYADPKQFLEARFLDYTKRGEMALLAEAQEWMAHTRVLLDGTSQLWTEHVVAQRLMRDKEDDIERCMAISQEYQAEASAHRMQTEDLQRRLNQALAQCASLREMSEQTSIKLAQMEKRHDRTKEIHEKLLRHLAFSGLDLEEVLKLGDDPHQQQQHLPQPEEDNQLRQGLDGTKPVRLKLTRDGRIVPAAKPSSKANVMRREIRNLRREIVKMRKDKAKVDTVNTRLWRRVHRMEGSRNVEAESDLHVEQSFKGEGVPSELLRPVATSQRRRAGQRQPQAKSRVGAGTRLQQQQKQGRGRRRGVGDTTSQSTAAASSRGLTSSYLESSQLTSVSGRHARAPVPAGAAGPPGHRGIESLEDSYDDSDFLDMLDDDQPLESGVTYEGSLDYTLDFDALTSAPGSYAVAAPAKDGTPMVSREVQCGESEVAWTNPLSPAYTMRRLEAQGVDKVDMRLVPKPAPALHQRSISHILRRLRQYGKVLEWLGATTKSNLGFHIVLEVATVAVQSWWRACLACQCTLGLRKERKVRLWVDGLVTRVQCLVRQMQARRSRAVKVHERFLDHTAAKIQSAGRRYLAKDILGQRREERHRHAMAVRIQGHARRLAAKGAVEQRRQRHREHDMAARIQAVSRRRAVRDSVDELRHQRRQVADDAASSLVADAVSRHEVYSKEKQAQREHDLVHGSAAVLQGLYRVKEAKQKAKLAKIDKHMEDLHSAHRKLQRRKPTEAEAAVIIQSRTRTFQARLRVKRLRRRMSVDTKRRQIETYRREVEQKKAQRGKSLEFADRLISEIKQHDEAKARKGGREVAKAKAKAIP